MTHKTEVDNALACGESAVVNLVESGMGEERPLLGNNERLPSSALSSSSRSSFVGLSLCFAISLLCGIVFGAAVYSSGNVTGVGKHSAALGQGFMLDALLGGNTASPSVPAAPARPLTYTIDTLPRMHVITVNAQADTERFAKFIMVLKDQGFTDQQIKSKLVRNMCVYWKEWPKNIAMVDYAYKSIYDFWGGKAKAVQQASLYHTFFKKSMEIIDAQGNFVGNPSDIVDTHHVPAGLSHFYELQLLIDAQGEDQRFIFESDGYGGLGASFKNFPMMMDNLPSDYELVILEEHDEGINGDLVKQFTGPDGNDVFIHKWDRQTNQAGIQYLIKKSAAKKVMSYAAQHGWDLIDAWLLKNICTGNGAVRNVLTCYSVNGQSLEFGGKAAGK